MMAGARRLWLVCIVLAACAGSEGGVTGTGISAISGNITAVRDSGRSRGTLEALPFPLRVTVAERSDLAAITDAEGTFSLDGQFSGAITLRFADARNDTELGALALEVPAGSQTVIENIEIETGAPPDERVRPQAVLQLDVFGHADLVECAADRTGTLLLTDDGQPPRQFLIVLTAETEIERRDGTPLRCDEIGRGVALRIAGFARRRDRVIVAREVIVAARRPPPPDLTPRPERLHGVVLAVACEDGLIVVQQRGVEPVRRAVRVSDATEFRCPPDGQAACDCSAVIVGSGITVAGTIFPARPGQVQAEVVTVVPLRQ